MVRRGPDAQRGRHPFGPLTGRMGGVRLSGGETRGLLTFVSGRPRSGPEGEQTDYDPLREREDARAVLAVAGPGRAVTGGVLFAVTGWVRGVLLGARNAGRPGRRRAWRGRRSTGRGPAGSLEGRHGRRAAGRAGRLILVNGRRVGLEEQRLARRAP